MTDSPALDLSAAHRHFAASCFNETWKLLDQIERTSDEERLMIASALASVYHWLQRPDHTAQHLSIGYWQVSRVHAVLKRPAEALHYAEVCESYSPDLTPFYRGFALEAIARAASLSGKFDLAEQAKRDAMQLLPMIVDAQERELLAQDLATV